MKQNTQNTLVAVQGRLRSIANPEKAKLLSRYFKTGKGEYAEGDLFLGLMVPDQRKVAKEFSNLPVEEALRLLESRYHEERLTALFILISQFEKGGEPERKNIFNQYLAHTRFINNWDLVDLSAPRIVGRYLAGREKKILLRLAKASCFGNGVLQFLPHSLKFELGAPRGHSRSHDSLLVIPTILSIKRSDGCCGKRERIAAGKLKKIS